jgi:malonyl CoA-acyl carrier protein transacylase
VPKTVERPLHLLTLSAKTEAALAQLADRYEKYLANDPSVALEDICFSANAGRSQFKHRLGIIASSSVAVREKLAAFKAGQSIPGIFSASTLGANRPKIAFLFTGQGSQYIGMGRQLYETQPTFRAALDKCAQILQPDLETPLLEVLYPQEGRFSPIDETAYTQPALFALEYALFKLWESWGIKPDVVMGHSVGEYVAACVAGVFSLEDGLKLIAARGRLMQALPPDGEMVAVLADEAKVREAIAPYLQKVAIAAINGPKNIVISGKSQAVDAVVTVLEAKGVKAKKLQVSHAFHSPLMEPMLGDFKQVAAGVTFSKPRIRLVSNVTGKFADAELATPDYWCRHVRQPVQFAASMETLAQQRYELFVEIGPSPVLLGMGRTIVENSSLIQWLPSLRRGCEDWQQMLESLATLYVRGVSVDWMGFDRDYRRRRVVLPTYPFQRQRCWIEPKHDARTPAESLSPKIVPTALVNLLQEGNTQQLAAQIERAGNLSEEEIKVVPKLLEILVKQHQQQQTAAVLQDWLYEVQWQTKPRQLTEISFQEPGRWLIFADRGGSGQALASQLQVQGQHCLLVYAGENYQVKAPGTWQLNPLRPEDFARLFQEVADTSKPPLKGIVHLWSLDAELATELNVSALDRAQAIACGSSLHLVQAIVNHIQSDFPPLWLVTKGTVPINSSLPGVAQASLWGLGKVIAIEHPELWGGQIDLDCDAPSEEVGNLLTEIWDSQGEDRIAFRSGQRYVARLVRNQAPEVSSVSLQADSTYLITGGLGALGLKVAQWMVEQGVRHLVLTSRREASDRVLEALAQMEKVGAEVVVARADVAEWGDMVQLFEQIETSMPPLRGIIHAAGVLDDGILRQQNWERFAKVMAPKVQGTWNLHRLTQQLPVDFFVSFSSAASLLGSPGQGNYAAANAFMDAVAHYRRAAGLPGLSINWGPWDEAGMAASLGERDRARMSAQGLEPIPLAQGLSVLEKLLGQTAPQVGVLPIEWSVFRKQLNAGRQLPLLSELVGEVEPLETELTKTKQNELLERLESVPEGARYDLLRTHIQLEVAKMLGLNDSQLPGFEQGFFELGMDSLMAVELRNRINQLLGVTLPSTLTFDFSNIEQLTKYIASQVLNLNAGDETQQPDKQKEKALEANLANNLLNEIEQASEEELEGAIDQILTSI